ncbi:MAG: glycoside hydrolase family 2 protein [Agathobacter sp.]|nr:glycoside hydrolase family 2 protein [Agathobacter sp.]
MSRIYLNDEWLFTEEFSEHLCDHKVELGGLTEVRLPHTCKELPFNYFDENDYQMVSGYRRVLFAPEEWSGKAILFTCEGAAHETTVYVNGQVVAKHACGYTGFTMDIANYLVYGQENTIVLRVDSRESLNVPPFGFVIDYMTFGGVYREVYLEVKEPEHIQDVFVKTEVNISGSEDVCLVCQVELSEAMRMRSSVDKTQWSLVGSLSRAFTDVCPYDEKDEFNKETFIFEEILDIQESKIFSIDSVMIHHIHMWNSTKPYLYNLKVELVGDSQVYDTFTTRFGFRQVEFKADGFYLNHEKFKIRGLNRHQSYPYVGYAMPESMQKLDADILKKELGCNAVRTSHYPQSHHFIDRCDELGLFVFMEFPGWQHIGDGDWKMQACQNARDMICQFRNHPSIMIWGIRINESGDDDAFYTETNRIAHDLDDTRQTGGVRNFKNSHLLEDVYTYNEFVHDGVKPGCEPKKNVTSDMSKGYLITEYNGHMYPTKPFDWEEHRLEHAMRHARVIDAVGKEADIAGSFGWCMFDYNTHKDFGAGDRICYHGVTDMFRNSKLAASVYACQQEESIVLEVSSSMDIGEHPATNLGNVYLFSNADSVKMYKNNHFIKEYTSKDSVFQGIAHGPILVDDFVGDMLETVEGFKPKQAKMIAEALNYIAIHGYQNFPLHIIWKALKAVVGYHMKPEDLVNLYIKYIGNWGETATEYRFEAIKNGEIIKTIYRKPMKSLHLETKISHTTLVEKHSYDVAAIRLRALDDNDNLAPYYQEGFSVEVEGPIALIGPEVISLKGGMGGLYVKSLGKVGQGKVRIHNQQLGTTEVVFEIVKEG